MTRAADEKRVREARLKQIEREGASGHDGLWLIEQLRAAWAREEELRGRFRPEEWECQYQDGMRAGMAAARAALDPMIADARAEFDKAQTRTLRDLLKSDIATLESAQKKIDALLGAAGEGKHAP